MGHVGSWDYGGTYFTNDYSNQRTRRSRGETTQQWHSKFGTKAERNKDLWQHAQRRSLPYDKPTEDKIAFHSKELKKKYRGGIKIRHRQADNTTGVSSPNSNISKTMTTRKQSKPQPCTSRSRKSSATTNTSTAASTSSPTTLKGKRNRRAPYCYGFESSVCSVSDQESIPMPKGARTTNPVIVTVIQEEAWQPPLVESSFEFSEVSTPGSRIRPLTEMPPYHENEYADNEQEGVFEAHAKLSVVICVFVFLIWWLFCEWSDSWNRWGKSNLKHLENN